MTYRIIATTVAVIIGCVFAAHLCVWADVESLSGDESVLVEEERGGEEIKEGISDPQGDEEQVLQPPVEGEDLLEDVAKLMNEIRRLLEELQSGKLTQEKQSEAIGMLTQLVEIAKQQQCNSSGQGGGGSQQQQQQSASQQQVSPQKAETQEQPQEGTTGMRDEQATFGSVKNGPRRPLTADTAEWGNLPPRLREEVMQALEEDFPQRYKSLLRQYYKTLSEEE